MKNNPPLVSVLTAAYNHENYVQESIQSAMDQTYDNIELIVIDDGSTDNTWQKIQEMHAVASKRFKNVKFITKENSGTCQTLNLLIENASGSYLYFCASDDKLKNHSVQKKIDFLEANPDYALCIGDNEFIDFNGNRVYWDKDCKTVYEESEATYKTFADYLKHMRPDVDFNSEEFGSYMSLYLGNYVTNGFLIKKSIFEKIGKFTLESPLEDYWLMLQIAKYAKIKYFDEILFSYRWHDTNTAKNTQKMLQMTHKSLEYEREILKLPKFDEFNKSLRPIIKCKNITTFLKVTKEIAIYTVTYRVVFFGITCLKFVRAQPE